MNFKEIFVKGLRSACQFLKGKQVCKENTNQNLKTMEPTKNKTKLMPVESEIIIDINRRGACKFKVISKVESAVDENTNLLNKKGEAKDRSMALKYGFIVKQFDENTKSVSKSVDSRSPMLSVQTGKGRTKSNSRRQYPPTSQYVALDCEFVGVRNDQSALGRCSIVDYDGNVICDIYARPFEKITHYRTKWSGITKEDMEKSIPLESALSQITDIIKDKIVVGHALHNDFRVLGFNHPTESIRDTLKCPPLIQRMNFEGVKNMSLKNYAWKLLGKDIQNGGHCSVIDAQTAMDLYKLVRYEWEEGIINDDEEDNNGGKTSKKKKSDVDKVQNSTETVERVDNHVEKDNSLDKMKVSQASDNVVTVPWILERNGQNVKVGQKRKITDCETELEKANGMHTLSCVKSLTERIGTIPHNPSVDLCLKSGSSDSIKGPSISSSTCTSENFFSQNIQSNKSCDKVLRRQSKKRKPEGVRKSALAAEYTKNVKHLFHDLFWEDQDKLFHDVDCNV